VAADEGEQTICGYEYVFLFKGEKQTSTKMDTTLKNNSALSDVVEES
jgi:inosine/xanthosine triphosphate pyrophosphatase family protein